MYCPSIRVLSWQYKKTCIYTGAGAGVRESTTDDTFNARQCLVDKQKLSADKLHL